MNSLFVDPGKKKSACARFNGPTLEAVGFWPEIDPRHLQAVVIEKPEVYPGMKSKNPNDLIDLAMAAEHLAMELQKFGAPPPKYVFPREWKGQVVKPIHHSRVWATLDLGERTIVAKAIGMFSIDVENKIRRACESYARTRQVRGYSWEAHNLLDAAALGCWYFGRIGTGGVRR